MCARNTFFGPAGTLALVILMSCNACAQVGDSALAVPRGAAPVPFDQIVFERFSGIDAHRRLVVQDAESWSRLWRQIAGNRTPQPPPPTADFSRDMLVVAAMGTRATGGYTISVAGVYRDQSRLFVVVREVSPSSDCMLIQAITAPVAVARVPRSVEPATFVEQQETLNCR
jgi:hypothetical protein